VPPSPSPSPVCIYQRKPQQHFFKLKTNFFSFFLIQDWSMDVSLPDLAASPFPFCRKKMTWFIF
jgi:hypothetical protein